MQKDCLRIPSLFQIAEDLISLRDTCFGMFICPDSLENPERRLFNKRGGSRKRRLKQKVGKAESESKEQRRQRNEREEGRRVAQNEEEEEEERIGS